LPEDCDSDSDSDEESDLSKSPPSSIKEKRSWVSKLLYRLGRQEPTVARARAAVTSESPEDIMTGHSARYKRAGSQLRTLQRYGGGPNPEFMTFMERNSAMTRNGLAVCAEQVSVFLHSSNTVISFFEQSADDIEAPILRRLATSETILRRSCDASMLVQSILDTIIDHAVPIATAYSEIIQELELDVLTEPDIKHTRELYLLTSETATMRNFISPIATLIRALRDRTVTPNSPAAANNNTLTRHESGPSVSHTSTVDISPLAHTYLGDVEDHCLSILSELDQIATSASGLISLIFNTISAYQNESMKQLTVVTVILLPLTVITGFYGMNFTDFDALNNNTNYFWSIAAPVAVGMGLLMMREMIVRWFKKVILKWGRRRRRERRERKERERKERELRKRR
jgi:Mg2+ and Co2+ transporter CorA